MKDEPFRLALCQRPDDRFLHQIPLPVLYKLPAFLEFQGREFPRQLLMSDMLYEDADGKAVLDIKRLRARVVVRIEKSGQRIRSRRYPYRPPEHPHPHPQPQPPVAEQQTIEPLQNTAESSSE